MWLYVAGKHEVHSGVENFRTNTEAGPWRTGFVFLPTEEQGEFLLLLQGHGTVSTSENGSGAWRSSTSTSTGLICVMEL